MCIRVFKKRVGRRTEKIQTSVLGYEPCAFQDFEEGERVLPQEAEDDGGDLLRLGLAELLNRSLGKDRSLEYERG